MTELIAKGFLTIVLRGEYQQVEPFADQSVSQELRKKLSPEENLPTSDHSRLEEYVTSTEHCVCPRVFSRLEEGF